MSDRIKALEWFEVLFGRPADEIIGEEHLWQVGENAWVVVDDRDVRAERVGGAMITRRNPRHLAPHMIGRTSPRNQCFATTTT
ncbi:hypothetical protein ACWDQL_13115 [Streptomyces olivaceus]